MLSRTIRKSILDIRIPPGALPPVFLLPNRARYFNSTTQHVEPLPNDSQLTTAQSTTSPIPQNQNLTRFDKLPKAPSPLSKPLELDQSVKELLPLLSVQPSQYVSVHIHGKPYLVTVGDIVRLPFQMPAVIPGDILRLNRASSIGSRDYTLKGVPYVDERLFECRARVMGTEAEPMRIKEKKKRRNRRVKTVKSKHKFTILRISELKIKNLEEIEG